jgi:hypothetical protein
MIFEIFSPKNLAKKIKVFDSGQSYVNYAKKLIITLVFDKNANFCGKLSKIAENFDHNLDPGAD